jgi:hypothetical protein
MVMSKQQAVYPYTIKFERTGKWFDGDWKKYADWCDEHIGKGEWNYFYNEFVFTEEKYLMLFKLKWL